MVYPEPGRMVYPEPSRMVYPMAKIFFLTLICKFLHTL
jgi:hypothetical protein